MFRLMYVPEWFQLQDEGLILETVRANSFATLVVAGEVWPIGTHVPLVVESASPLVFLGHVARKSDVAPAILSGAPALAVFAGPHAYVSPRYYETEPAVPTWNYVAVHASGAIEPILDEGQVLDLLEKLVVTYDPELVRDRDFYAKQVGQIVAFRLRVESLEAKAKMSQNKSERDQDKVVRSLEGSGIPEDAAVASWMRAKKNL